METLTKLPHPLYALSLILKIHGQNQLRIGAVDYGHALFTIGDENRRTVIHENREEDGQIHIGRYNVINVGRDLQ